MMLVCEGISSQLAKWQCVLNDVNNIHLDRDIFVCVHIIVLELDVDLGTLINDFNLSLSGSDGLMMPTA